MLSAAVHARICGLVLGASASRNRCKPTPHQAEPSGNEHAAWMDCWLRIWGAPSGRRLQSARNCSIELCGSMAHNVALCVCLSPVNLRSAMSAAPVAAAQRASLADFERSLHLPPGHSPISPQQSPHVRLSARCLTLFVCALSSVASLLLLTPCCILCVLVAWFAGRAFVSRDHAAEFADGAAHLRSRHSKGGGDARCERGFLR